MNDLPVIRADFATWRPVQGRKVIQLIFEVPIEQTHEVMTKLGVPMPGESLWCGVVRLKDSAVLRNEAEKAPEDAPISSGAAPKERKPFNTLPLSQQCAIRCQDNDFMLFLGASHAEDAAEKVRRRCFVSSRSEIRPDTRAGFAWIALEAEYQKWLTDQRYSEARR